TQRVIAGPRIGRIELATPARRIDACDNVMHDRPIAGTKIDGPNPAIFREIGLENENAEVITARGCQVVTLGHCQDGIRLTQRPVRGNLPRRWGIFRVAFGATGINPRLECGDLVPAQYPSIEKRTAETR